MKYKILKTPFSLSDPESRLIYQRINNDVKINFKDWQNQEHIIKFIHVELFSYTWHQPYADLPDQALL